MKVVNKVDIRVANWPVDKNSLSQIRHRVFVEEQKVPEDLEWDEFDESSAHFLVTIKDQAIACARLKNDGQIGRMAVLAEYRNRGIGYQLLQYVIQYAAENEFKKLYLHAQLDAIAFYEKQGFTAKGDIFYEANIPHREMLRNLC
jgi:predicted GNAT family N-acyltransferase